MPVWLFLTLEVPLMTGIGVGIKRYLHCVSESVSRNGKAVQGDQS